MTARVFADTNLFIYAESQDQNKALRTIEIIQAAPVISSNSQFMNYIKSMGYNSAFFVF